MNDVHFYEVNVKWTDQRKGSLSAPSLETISVATPPEFPKGHSGIWSPEHYYIAAISSCLMTTFLAIAENSRLAFSSFECNAQGKLEKVDGKFMISEVLLQPRVTIEDETETEKAKRVIEKSEAACLISNSIKTKVILNPAITVNKRAA